MVSQNEIDIVINWCDRIKKEKKKIYIVERNPFRDEIRWTMRFPLIEIDRPKEVAAKTSLVYYSTTKQLWQYMNDDWRKIEKSIEFKIE